MTEEPKPVLDQLNIVVRDMEASAAFYQRLGLQVGGTGDAWDAWHRSARDPAGIDLDLDSIPFSQKWDAGWQGGPGVVIGFRVPTRDEVDRLYEELTDAGHAGQQPPYDAFWGSRYAVVEDPDGNAVGLMSPMDAAFRSAPPEGFS